MNHHPFADQIATMRLTERRHRTDILIFVMAVAAGLSLIVTAALQAPPGWTPF